METVWRVDIDRLVRWVLPLPTGAFIFCVILSLLFNFEQSTSTHCKQVEFLLLIYNWYPVSFACSLEIYILAQATVPSWWYRSLVGYDTIKFWRYRNRRGYGAVNTVSFSVSVTKLVLTPTPNPKRVTKSKFHHEMAHTFQMHRYRKGDGYTNYHR